VNPTEIVERLFQSKTTETEKDAVRVLPSLSVAVTVTDWVPTEKSEPEGGL
jgi:hypothetical protein